MNLGITKISRGGVRAQDRLSPPLVIQRVHGIIGQVVDAAGHGIAH